jgi:Rps23 Pro-64 3,4-dihydroxylase Tpa1-like proline 4-hydroxylase
MPFLTSMDADGLMSPDGNPSLGTDLRATYDSATPFPHIVIDNFLPEQVAEMCLRAFPSSSEGSFTFDRAQEKLKTQFNPDYLQKDVRNLFYNFNSRPFIRVLENICGIKGLTPDPYFLGAGFHETRNTGYLSIHADFNHHRPMNLERRINVLIYLNKDWKSEYGGRLELWNDDVTSCVTSVLPVFNRCVIFNTTSRSWHGNPEPVNHPSDDTRKSIALYYYTATWTDAGREHTTQFQVRKGSDDKVDWRVRSRELARDLLPPLVQRNLSRIRHKGRVSDQVD